ncbi:SDR family oxidoreductase [Sediminicoccus sp. KRV36]|uniref:SDR family oxidoreductase n=1 Tax=Sediminicoccus sp. KRV36 TaxID=3133721 RepID=UPI00200C37D8|nr:SDR family oxidoreductase [Sediminicoccus rosea]UPY35548.1 SDR family oxidoreductase [Sediminicoccus rosea]
MRKNLLIIGNGYTGEAILDLARRSGWAARITSRNPGGAPGVISFDDPALLAGATHLVVTAPPGPAGDPVWARHAAALRAAPLRWVGYLSTTGVYGDRQGAWVEEDTPPSPGQERSRRRLAAEDQWRDLASGVAVDLFRTGGIYGPGRSPLDDVRAGTARCVVKPGHSFSRIHRDDIARAVLAAASRPPAPGARVLHLVDDEPSTQADVTLEACRLLGVAPPPPTPFAEAYARMSEMGRSFWDESRRVASRRTQQALGIAWAFPSYREGLAGIFAAERGEQGAQRPAQ